MRRRTRWLAGAVVLAAVSVVGAVFTLSGASPATGTSQEGPANTVKVKMETLSAMVSIDGTLTYRAQADGSPYSVINQLQGTYTALPELGQLISQGQVIYRVNNGPIVLLSGSTPAYRTLSEGATGVDVAELNADLVALGYATGAQLDPASGFFGPATTSALQKLQATVGMTQSGTLSLGQVAFEPTALRVTALTAQLGGGTQVGQTVIEATSTTRQVDVALDASHQADVSVGDKVSITLPDNESTPGVVSSVGTVASCPSNSPSGASSSGSAALGTDACSSNSSGSSAPPTITVEVTPSDPAATGTWDQAPVQVTVTTGSVSNALVVPVTALLAQAGGGYAVEVVGPGNTHRLVTVSLGLFDDADELVQVTGKLLAAGQDVVVPTI